MNNTTKRQRRNFTKQFKKEIVKSIISGDVTKLRISQERNISIPLLDRWINDHLAADKISLAKTILKPLGDRRQDYQDTQALKAKIAELYMQIETLQKSSRQSHKAMLSVAS